METKWNMCKEIINNALGFGYYGTEFQTQTEEFYAAINGDFGIPTESDLKDFQLLLADIPSANRIQLLAKIISQNALHLIGSL